MAIDLSRYYDLLKDASLLRVRGRVTELTGLIIKASVPNVRVGEVVYIKSRTRGSVKPLACSSFPAERPRPWRT